MRKILYVTGTRADFGLMHSTLKLLDEDPGLDLAVMVTGMHLLQRHGMTVAEIESSGFRIAARIPVALEPATGSTMARAIATMIGGFVDVLEAEGPDIVLLLGDRGEMLAAAIAAIHQNIPVAHIHGGERSGTVDESVRHAISKLSHIHFAATKESRDRLVAMGEKPANIFETGAPGLDGLTRLANRPFGELALELGLSQEKQTCLFLFHPVLQEAEESGKQAETILSCLIEDGWQVVAMMPNSDAGSEQIRESIELASNNQLHPVTHLSRADFLSLLKSVDLMIGNSSAGIIEAASFGTPVLNLGNRQVFRERNKNVRDLEINRDDILKALNQARNGGRFPAVNVYGDGKAGERICARLKSIDLNRALLEKVMEY